MIALHTSAIHGFVCQSFYIFTVIIGFRRVGYTELLV